MFHLCVRGISLSFNRWQLLPASFEAVLWSGSRSIIFTMLVTLCWWACETFLRILFGLSKLCHLSFTRVYAVAWCPQHIIRCSAHYTSCPLFEEISFFWSSSLNTTCWTMPPPVIFNKLIWRAIGRLMIRGQFITRLQWLEKFLLAFCFDTHGCT